MIAQTGELFRLGVGGIGSVEDGFSRPDTDMTIASGGSEACAIGRYVAAVDLVVLFLAGVAQPERFSEAHAVESTIACVLPRASRMVEECDVHQKMS